MTDPGSLFICPTPLGNLEDITLRVLRVLKEVDWIAAENTKHTQKLLNHFGIHQKLISYYDLGESQAKEKKLIELLKHGSSIALVSSAGTPLLSDPGYKLVQQCIQEQIPVIPLPGPSALITALAGSGLPPHPFYFGGFLPPKSNARKALLQNIEALSCTLIFYETPHRISESLKDSLEILGNRHAVLARELTKIHEEFLRHPLADLAALVSDTPLKGEMTLIIAGKEKQEINWSSLEEEIRTLLEKGVSASEASRRLAKKHELSKNKIYPLAHQLSDRHTSFRMRRT